jgi:HEAT repeat protein
MFVPAIARMTATLRAGRAIAAPDRHGDERPLRCRDRHGAGRRSPLAPTLLVAAAAAWALTEPQPASAQGTAKQLLAELASGDSTRCMDAGNSTSEHQEHYQTLAAELAPALVTMLEEQAPCAGSALSALVNLGPGIAEGAPAERAVPVLARIVEGEIERELTDQASSAVLVIGHYGPGAAAAVPVLERFVRERSQMHERSYAIGALAAIGDAAAPAVPALLELLAPFSPEEEGAWEKAQLRVEVVRALGAMPTAIDRSGPHLAAALADDDSSYAWTAQTALLTLGAKAVPHLVPLLSRSGTDVPERALRVLAEIGAGAGAAAPAVLRVLGADDWAMRNAARTALVAMGPTPEVVAGLAKLLDGSDEEATVAAAETLGELGKGASAALPGLRKAARSDSWPVKMAAEAAIEQIETTQ